MATDYFLDSTPFTTYGKLDGGPATYPGEGHNAQQLLMGCAIRFQTNATADIIIHGFLSGEKYDIYIDGVFSTTVTVSNLAAYADYTLVSGAAAGVYEIMGHLEGEFTYTTKIVLSSAALATVVQPAKSSDYYYGDSISVSFGLTDLTHGYAFKTSRQLGRGFNCCGGSGGTTSYLSYYVQIDNRMGSTGNRVIVQLGVNDCENQVTIGSVGSAGTLKDDVYNMLVNVRAKIGASKWILYQQFYAYSGVHSADRATYNAAIAAAVAQYISATSDAFVLCYPTDGWIVPASDTTDGTHPIDAGALKIANRLKPLLNGYGNGGTGFTLSGPVAGAYTVTLAQGATFTGDQKITLAASAGNITAIAAGGTIANNGTGTVGVTPVAGATSFTYTASATATISYTNDQLWDNPGNTSYVPPDTTPPTITAPAINAAGTTLTLTYSESVTGVAASDYGLTGAEGVYTLSAASGSGATRTMTISPAVQGGETCTLDYSGFSTVDVAGNQLATFSGSAITNNSTQAPRIPTGVNLSLGGSETQVYWNSRSVVTTFRINRGLLADHSDTVEIGSSAGNATTYDDFTTVSGVHYYYRVKARNSFGDSAFVDVDGIAQGPLSPFTPGAGGGKKQIGQLSQLRHIRQTFG